MKKLELTATYKEAKEAAKTFSINPVGKSAATLVEMVNAKIDEQTAEKKTSTPSKTLEDYGLEAGQIVTISGFESKGKMILVNRQVSITRVSRAKGYIKARLVNSETGELQKTEIAITPEIIINEEESQVVA